MTYPKGSRSDCPDLQPEILPRLHNALSHALDLEVHTFLLAQAIQLLSQEEQPPLDRDSQPFKIALRLLNLLHALSESRSEDLIFQLSQAIDKLNALAGE